MSTTFYRDGVELDPVDPESFFKTHCGLPGGYILVMVWEDEYLYATGVFDSFKTATDWSEKFKDNPDITSCIFIPHFLNYPDYGEFKPVH